MASKVALLKWLSVLNVAHGLLAIILGIASINVTDFYVGFFGMGIWLGGLMLLTGLAGLSSASHAGNRYRLKIFFSCNVVTIVTMITCNIIIGTVAITHFQYESTVSMDYKNQNNQDHYKAEEDFKASNEAGKIGLTVYSIVMGVITSDVLLNAALVLISRDLFQTATTGSSNSNTTEMTYADQNFLELAFQSTTSRQQVCDIRNQSCQLPVSFKLPNYADLYPERINNWTGQMCEPMEVCDLQEEPPPAYSPRIPSCSPHSSIPGSPFVLSQNSYVTPEVGQHTG
ncbi:PREDICTED: uncharacterized protein LOC107333259 isoform X3 [Acropora digitifera]|uniref:uncharacterized protein LOC107333259 isoform X3 n=1 Tax=Acropora digitifera TaxID=70779 RepID=UPI00077A8B29|nr:PREDICTED: uncharacterized protein LOC107333259 isoform X3 [Acropora digitifera]